MALVNYATREINAKIVYYGPGLSGKTTNIHYVFNKVKPKNKGKLISLATQGDRTLFFDFLPVELGSFKGFKTRFHLYTVPGQVFYNSTRKLVLKGADGVVFVADSQKMMRDENIQSLDNLRENLAGMGINFDEFPVVIQYNKRDLPDASSVEEMEEYLNPAGRPFFAASAIKGDGVLVALTAVVKNILHNLKQEQAGDFEGFHEGSEPVVHEKEDTVSIRVAAPTPAPSLSSIPGLDVLHPLDKPEAKLPAAMPEVEDEPMEAELHQEEGAPHAEPEITTHRIPVQPVEETHDVAMPMLDLSDEKRSGDNLLDSYEDFLANVKSPMIPDDEPEQDIRDVIENIPPVEGFGNADFHVTELLKKDVEDASRFNESFLGDTEGPAASSPEAKREILAAQEVVEEIPPLAALKPAPAPEPAPYEGGPKSVQSFFIPLRITTTSGIKEMNLRVNIDMGLLGEGTEQVTKIEALQPVSRIPISPRSAKEAAPPLPATERPRQAPAPLPKASQKETKSSVFQRFLGIK